MDEIAQRFSAGTLFFIVLLVGIILAGILSVLTGRQVSTDRTVGFIGLVIYGGICYLIANELGWLFAIFLGFVPLALFIGLIIKSGDKS